MKNNLKITDSEWLIMKVLWKNNPLTSSEIIRSLKSNTIWEPTTIQTLISRLTKKGIIKIEKTSPNYLYSPIVTEEECRNIETKSFIKKVYDGSLQLFVANFINEVNLSSKEIDEIKRILDGKKD